MRTDKSDGRAAEQHAEWERLARSWSVSKCDTRKNIQTIVNGHGIAVAQKVTRDNAPLVVAAPKLRESLRAMVDQWEVASKADGYPPAVKAARELLETLDKAEPWYMKENP